MSSEEIENILGKGENANYQHFSHIFLFPKPLLTRLVKKKTKLFCKGLVAGRIPLTCRFANYWRSLIIFYIRHCNKSYPPDDILCLAVVQLRLKGYR